MSPGSAGSLPSQPWAPSTRSASFSFRTACSFALSPRFPPSPREPTDKGRGLPAKRAVRSPGRTAVTGFEPIHVLLSIASWRKHRSDPGSPAGSALPNHWEAARARADDGWRGLSRTPYLLRVLRVRCPPAEPLPPGCRSQVVHANGASGRVALLRSPFVTGRHTERRGDLVVGRARVGGVEVRGHGWSAQLAVPSLPNPRVPGSPSSRTLNCVGGNAVTRGVAPATLTGGRELPPVRTSAAAIRWPRPPASPRSPTRSAWRWR